VLSKGGSFDYQFLLPGGHWGKMTLDLGSPTGSAAQAGTPAVPGVGVPSAPGLTVRASSAGPGGLALSAFNFQTGAWEPVDVSLSSGDLMAGIAHPDAYLGTGSVLDVRLTARVPGLEVFGAGPTLSAARATGRP
jgi:hypothetical protein